MSIVTTLRVTHSEVSSSTHSLVMTQLRGPQGPAGIGSGSAYLHNQGVAALTWTINHNLGFRPSVELLTVGGVEFEADISHPTVNQTVITCLTARAGSARLT